MARQQFVGVARVWWLTACANVAAPTVAEINAGVDLTPHLRRDGLDTPREGNEVDASDMASLDQKQSVGSRTTGPIALEIYRDSVPGSETAYTALAEDSVGFLVVRPFGGSTVAPAAAQKVENYPTTVSVRGRVKSGLDENQRANVKLVVTGVVNLNATVAA